jgi:histidine ammonia-lyase
LEYRKPLKPGRGAHKGYEFVRQHVAQLTADRAMSSDIEKIAELISATALDTPLK